ncbi:hypothetical protein [Chamaesiphon sp. VAR_69_metabat_338]|uniref:hypothetical protein n=1 Tax=Chamaesiphon sp. VAR_69_metabat_338 TaxID=2964704 RepID=UPI00286E9A88|nr:hypothetical protein [Chamaesiphon sp. VAR_69_metabat_338]
MNVFSAKSIGLYTLAIGSAIGFFNLVTSYGEANIKAPQPMAGIYQIIAKDLPGCLQHKTLLLNIQQSGIYLNANLNAIDVKNADTVDSKAKDRLGLAYATRTSTTPSTNPRPTFSGKLQGQKLDLSGTVPTTTCPIRSQLRLSGSLAQSGTQNGRQLQLQGQLWLTDRTHPQGSPINITAIQQPQAPSTAAH